MCAHSICLNSDFTDRKDGQDWCGSVCEFMLIRRRFLASARNDDKAPSLTAIQMRV